MSEQNRQHRYRVAGFAKRVRTDGSVQRNDHAVECYAVLASSGDEAYGLALKIMRKVYDQRDGWQHHHVAVELDDGKVVTLESVRRCGGKDGAA